MPRPNRGAYLEKNDAGMWEIRWTEKGRSKRKSTRTADPVTANDKLRLHKIGSAEIDPTTLTFAEAWDMRWEEYWEEQLEDKTRYKVIGRNLKKHIGGKLIVNISQTDIANYKAARKKAGISDGCLRLELTIFNSTINYLIKDKRLPAHYRVPLKQPPKSPPRHRWLDTEETARLYAAARHQRKGLRLSRMERFLAIGLSTGARPGFISELRWSQINFSLNNIDFTVPGRRLTSKKRPVVPISETLLPVIQRAYRERISDYVLDSHSRLDREFEALSHHAGVQDITPITLRHTVASHMVMSGHPTLTIAKLLGTSVQMIEQHYGHLASDYLSEIVNTPFTQFRASNRA